MSTDHKYAGEMCPTCRSLGITKGDGAGGVLFVNRALAVTSDESFYLYECDYAEHYMDEETIKVMLRRHIETVELNESQTQPALCSGCSFNIEGPHWHEDDGGIGRPNIESKDHWQNLDKTIEEKLTSPDLYTRKGGSNAKPFCSFCPANRVEDCEGPIDRVCEKQKSWIDPDEVVDYEEDACPTCGYELYWNGAIRVYQCHGKEVHKFTQDKLDQTRKALREPVAISQIERAHNREIDRRVYESFYPGSTGNPTEK